MQNIPLLKVKKYFPTFKGGLSIPHMGFPNFVKKSNLQVAITFYDLEITPTMYIFTKRRRSTLSHQLQDKVESGTQKWSWTHSGDIAFFAFLISHPLMTCRFKDDIASNFRLVLKNDIFGPLTYLHIPWISIFVD